MCSKILFPNGMEEFTPFFIGPLISMSPKKVSLCLNNIGGIDILIECVYKIVG